MNPLYNVKIHFENQVLDLEENGMEIVNLAGFDPAGATISRSRRIGKDGSKENNKYIESRSINIQLEIKTNVKDNIMNLYKFFIPKENIIIEYTNSFRHVFAYGTVEDIDVDRFTLNVPTSINIVCSDPYLYHYQRHNDILQNSNSIDLVNNGDIKCGMLIKVTCLQDTNLIKLTNQTNNQFFYFNHQLKAGDIVEIDSNLNSYKTIYLYRNNEKINLFNDIVKGSKWLLLEKGNNTIISETTSQRIEFIHDDLFIGA